MKNNMRHFLKSIVMAFLIGMASLSAYAQSKEHIVERGETLSTIAAKYSVDEAEIIRLNPDAKNFLYAGMVLTIPEETSKTKENAISKPTTTVNSSYSYTETTNRESRINDEKRNQSQASTTNEDQAENLFFIGINYRASFKDFSHGLYGFSIDAIYTSNIGFTFGMDMNYGLVKPGTLHTKFGPQYAVHINEYIIPRITMCGYIGAMDVVKGQRIVTSSYSGTKVYDETGIICTGGIIFTPGVLLKFNRMILGIGYDLGFQSVNLPIPDGYAYYAPAKSTRSRLDDIRKDTHSEIHLYKKEMKTSFVHSFHIMAALSF